MCCTVSRASSLSRQIRYLLILFSIILALVSSAEERETSFCTPIPLSNITFGTLLVLVPRNLPSSAYSNPRCPVRYWRSLKRSRFLQYRLIIRHFPLLFRSSSVVCETSSLYRFRPAISMEPSSVAAPYLPSQQDRRPNSHLAVPGSSDPSGLLSQFQGMSLGGMGMPNTHSAPIHMGPPYMLGSDGHFVLAPVQGSQTIPLGHSNENGYGNYVNGAFSNPYLGMHLPLMPFTPGRANAVHARVDRTQSEAPGLENRRNSYSTTESAPATPFYAGGVAHHENGPRVASLDRSAYTTPSPQQLGLMPAHAEASKSKLSAMSERTLDDMLEKKPVIPKAVPAVFTPAAQMKGVEQSLQNPIPGNRNVYIRGLHPTTDDELLYHYASRFGPVETSKAIIDTGTGACKGFGFAKFYNVADSEMCIRGFHRLGYEVGFARESFNSRLKAEGDDSSTNLYISNLPKTLTEVELGTIFLGFTILSSKILRDSMGNSRGVGFARFESRDVCDEIIEKFTGIALGEEGLLMNIRYADTPAQKELKRVTAERRQFRTNEYNIGAYGTPLVGLNTHTYSSYQSHSQYHRSNNSSARSGAIPSATNTSGSDGSNGTRRSASQRRSMETAASSSLDEAIATPTSSECDENVTIHADTIIANASLHSSPSVKKEIKKETKKEVKKEVK
ncbi:hypothetical protein BHE90_004744 [Fusarium euwallaceae]|uniref:RRM domain-containing protein n=1 Tax=Fusarium euwallaceae TaxID=1147111 RepID=A0A430LYD4_9HYPO|nr:hypothetical protein BHE90_004744 [Fusarium euwallaceae]